MSLQDAFEPYEHDYRQKVLANTWGHLAPEPGRSYEGFVCFAHGVHGDSTIIEWQFEDLPPSPWFFDDLIDHMNNEIDRHLKDRSYGVWIWEGTFKVFKNGKSRWSGKSRPCRISPRSGKGRSL